MKHVYIGSHKYYGGHKGGPGGCLSRKKKQISFVVIEMIAWSFSSCGILFKGKVSGVRLTTPSILWLYNYE